MTCKSVEILQSTREILFAKHEWIEEGGSCSSPSSFSHSHLSLCLASHSYQRRVVLVENKETREKLFQKDAIIIQEWRGRSEQHKLKMLNMWYLLSQLVYILTIKLQSVCSHTMKRKLKSENINKTLQIIQRM